MINEKVRNESIALYWYYLLFIIYYHCFFFPFCIYLDSRSK